MEAIKATGLRVKSFCGIDVDKQMNTWLDENGHYTIVNAFHSACANNYGVVQILTIFYK